jgi:hypothetical protein
MIFKIRDFVSRAIWFVTAVPFFFMIVVRQWYTTYMPTRPDSSVGRTLPVTVNYNKIIYVDRGQLEFLHVVYAMFWVACVIGICFALSAGFIRTEKPGRPGLNLS